MTKDENIVFAKKNLIENIYKSAVLERINVTYEDTVDFINNVNNGKISIDDMLKLKGLKDAWEYVLNSVDSELTCDYIKQIHFQICKGQNVIPLGEYRKKGVGITGTDWRPLLPSLVDYDKELEELKMISNPLDRCISIFCWIQRSQMFQDGNKRVANLVANKEMIKNGLGVIAVPIEKIGEYLTYLIDFYETNDYSKISKYIKENCIDTL